MGKPEEIATLEVRLEILRCSYWEHLKIFNDKSLQGPWWERKQDRMHAEIQSITGEMEEVRLRLETLKEKKND